jgi:hypothetical protein
LMTMASMTMVLRMVSAMRGGWFLTPVSVRLRSAGRVEQQEEARLAALFSGRRRWWR